ncbi:MAG: hypothetical protein AAB731_01720 [Patescibacteria group bacterium]
MTIKKIFFFITMVAIYLLSAEKASAITIYPAIFEFNTSQNQPLADQMQIFNESDGTLTFAADIENFIPRGETGEQTYLSGNYGLASWISLSEKEITLAPKEKKYVSFKINLPPNAAPGSYSAGILWREKNDGQGGITITNRLGALALLSVAGETKTKAVIAEFSVPKSFFETLPVEFTARVANEGNALLKPSGEIVVKNIFGKTVAALEINSAGNALLPNSIRKWSAKWENKIIAVGPYSASLRVKYGAKNEIKSEIKFWVLPWKSAALILLGIIALIIFWKKTFGKIKKRISRI